MSYLKHHGILGMKWGKVNGPPYPLGASDHSASEKNAGWRKSLDKSSGIKKGLSDDQKKVLKKVAIGTAITAGVILAAYGGYKLNQSGLLKGAKSTGKSFVDSLPSDVGSSSSLKTSKSFTESLNGRNPLHIDNNCKDVAMAVAYSKAGKGDFVAGEKSFVGNLTDYMSTAFENASSHMAYVESANGSNAQDRCTKQILRKFKEGDTGCVALEFDKKYLKQGYEEAGHSFNWTIESGKVVYGDGQPDPPITDCSIYFSCINPSKQIEIAMIDDGLIEKDGVMAKRISKR